MQTEEPSSHQPTPQSSHQPTPQSSHHPISLSSHQPNPIESSTVQLKVLIMNLCNNHLTWRWMTMLHHQEKLEEGGSKVLYGTNLLCQFQIDKNVKAKFKTLVGKRNA